MIGALSDIGSVVTRWRTWALMGNQDVALRYRRSLLGPFWLSFSMAAMIMGIVLLYGQIFEQEFDTYLVYVAPGILMWGYIMSLIMDGCHIAIDAEGQLRSVRIPLPVLAARMVFRNFLIFLHNLLAVMVIIVATGNFNARPEALLAIPGIAVVTLIGFFGALILGPVCLRFRDVQQVIASAMQMMLFLTPVFWMPNQGRVSELVSNANPFFHMIQLVRMPIEGDAPAELNWVVTLCLMGGLMLASMLALSATRKRIFLWL